MSTFFGLQLSTKGFSGPAWPTAAWPTAPPLHLALLRRQARACGLVLGIVLGYWTGGRGSCE